MSNGKYRIFRECFPHHIFTKAANGFIIFYSQEDYIFYFTLYSCKSRKYKITVLAFDIMPNHTHSCEKCDNVITLWKFHDVLETEFATGYNREHNRKGNLFKLKFGYAPKTTLKKIRETLCYIPNNHVVGKIVGHVLQNRWNLLAYHKNEHPFSDKIILNKCSRKLRRSVNLVKYFRKNELTLTYERQRILFEGLSSDEKNQVVDLIVTEYNFLKYELMASYFNGSIESAVNLIESSNGSEYDIPEDYDDYSYYERMINLCEKKGIDMKHCNFELLSKEELRDLYRLLTTTGALKRQIFKFLHILSNNP